MTLLLLLNSIRSRINFKYRFVCSGCVVSGAGAFEVAVADALVKHKPNVKGRAQLGVQAFADALLVIPKVTAVDLFSYNKIIYLPVWILVHNVNVLSVYI